MEQAQFDQELSALSSLPESVIAYAQSVGAELAAEKRADLLEKLRAVHADLLPLVSEREGMEQDALRRIQAFQEKEMPRIKKGIEDAERTAAEKKFEHDIAA